MSRLIILLCFLLGNLYLFAQTVVDFPMEKLYVNEDTFFFGGRAGGLINSFWRPM